MDSCCGKIWNRFVLWLYQPQDLNWLIRMLLGIACLPVASFVWIWSHGGPGPYNVPAWRVGAHLLNLPLPAESLSQQLFLAVYISALALICGLRTKLPVVIIVFVLSYYASRDWFCMGSHITLMFLLMTAAFLFESKSKKGLSSVSPTKRLIQLSIGICYFFSALQKLCYPDFFLGYSMQETFTDGWGLNPIWQPYIRMVSIPTAVWMVTSIMVIGLEFFLAFGLFFKRTRKVALILAYLLHIGILVFLDYFIAIFSLIMFTGLLTFVQPRQALNFASESKTQVSGELMASALPFAKRPEAILLACFLVFAIAMPLRVYFWPGHPVDKLAFFDRSPWSFCMFLARQETKQLDILFQTQDGMWHPINGHQGRMGIAATDNEMYAIAQWLFQTHPEAKAAKIDLILEVNNRSTQRKSLVVNRQDYLNTLVQSSYSDKRFAQKPFASAALVDRAKVN